MTVKPVPSLACPLPGGSPALFAGHIRRNMAGNAACRTWMTANHVPSLTCPLPGGSPALFAGHR